MFRTDRQLKTGTVLLAEVYSFNQGKLLLRAPSNPQRLQGFLSTYSQGFGTLVHVVVVDLQELSFGRGCVLLVRDAKTGLDIEMGPRDLSFSPCPVVPREVFEAVGVGGKFAATLVSIDSEVGRVRLTTHLQAEDWIAKLPGIAEAIPATVLEREILSTSVRVHLDPPPERLGVVVAARYPAIQAPDDGPGKQVQVHLSPRRSPKQQWPENLDPPAIDALEWDESARTLKCKSRVSFETIRSWLADPASPAEQTALYSLYEYSNELFGTDPAIIDRLESFVGKQLTGKVRLVNNKGAEVDFVGEKLFYGWMWNSEMDWLGTTTVEVGASVRVKVIDCEPADGRKLIVSRKALLDNPYEAPAVKQGALVQAVVDKVVSGTGLNLHVDLSTPAGTIPLRAWMRDEESACRPGENPERLFAVGGRFDARVVEVEAGNRPQLKLSRQRLFFEVVRESVEPNFVVSVAFVRWTDSDRAAIVSLDGLNCVMDKQEIFWNCDLNPYQLLQPGQPFDVVISHFDHENGKVWVSRKRVLSRCFRVVSSNSSFAINWFRYGHESVHVAALVSQKKACILQKGDKDSREFEVGADDSKSFDAGWKTLLERAMNNQCSLVITEDLPRRWAPPQAIPLTLPVAKVAATQRPKVVKPAASIPQQTEPSPGFWERLLDWIASLFR